MPPPTSSSSSLRVPPHSGSKSQQHLHLENEEGSPGDDYRTEQQDSFEQQYYDVSSSSSSAVFGPARSSSALASTSSSSIRVLRSAFLDAQGPREPPSSLFTSTRELSRSILERVNSGAWNDGGMRKPRQEAVALAVAFGRAKARTPPSRREVAALREWLSRRLESTQREEEAMDAFHSAMASIIDQVGVHCHERGALLHDIWDAAVDAYHAQLESRDALIEAQASRILELNMELEQALRRFDASYIGRIETMHETLVQQNEALERRVLVAEAERDAAVRSERATRTRGLMSDALREASLQKKASLEEDVRALEREVRRLEHAAQDATQSAKRELEMERELRKVAEARAGPPMPEDIRGEMASEVIKKVGVAVTGAMELAPVQCCRIAERTREMKSEDFMALLERGELPEVVEERLGLDIINLNSGGSSGNAAGGGGGYEVGGSWMSVGRSRRRSSNVHLLKDRNQRIFDRYLGQLRQRMDMKDAELDYLREKIDRQQELYQEMRKKPGRPQQMRDFGTKASSYQAPSARIASSHTRSPAPTAPSAAAARSRVTRRAPSSIRRNDVSRASSIIGGGGGGVPRGSIIGGGGGGGAPMPSKRYSAANSSSSLSSLSKSGSNGGSVSPLHRERRREASTTQIRESGPSTSPTFKL